MAFRPRVATIVLAAVAMVAVLAVATPAAHAQATFDDSWVDFGGVDARVNAVGAIGDQVWVGGEFSTAFDPDDVTTYPRSHVAVFDFNTGEVHPFTVDTDQKVRALETDQVGTVWIGGNFTIVNGQPVTYITAINAHTGQIRPEFTVVVDYPIYSLHYDAGSLYIGGDFGVINGHFFNKMARVDAVTGEVDTRFRANPSAAVRSIDTYGDRVYAAGNFESVGKAPNEVARIWIAGFDRATGLPAGPEFAFAPLAPGEAAHKKGLWEVVVSPDGNYLYTGDQRNFITKWDRLTGEKLWSNKGQGDIQAVAADGASVYLGTHQGYLASNDERLLAALNAADGSIDNSFSPRQNSFLGTLDIHIDQGSLIAVGDFTTVNGQIASHVSVFRSPAWDGADPLVAPTPGDASCDAASTITDALVVAQYTTGIRRPVNACPLINPASDVYLDGGDANGDGTVTIVDALLIAQCTVGTPNVFCPA